MCACGTTHKAWKWLPNHFKPTSSAFTVLCSRHCCLVPELFHYPKRKPHSHQAVPPQLLATNHLSALCIHGFVSSDISYQWNHIIQHMVFCNHLLSLSIMYSRFIHVVTCIIPLNCWIIFHCVDIAEMATRSSVLAWRIPGTGEPGGLPSMGSHRVGHDWSDLAAAAAVWTQHICWSVLQLMDI